MGYIDGFVTPVPAANKEAYRAHALKAAPIFKEIGVRRLVESWGDEVPAGETTDYQRMVKLEDGEEVVFSFMEYGSRAERDAASRKMMTDERMRQMESEMPFDGMRMVYGGFEVVLDEGTSDGTGYIDGSVMAVPTAKRAAFLELAEKQCAAIRAAGGLRTVEAWGDDVTDGKVTDFRRGVKAGQDETVVFSFVEWPSRQVRDAAWGKLMADADFMASHDIYDEGRRVFGAFVPMVDDRSGR